MQSVGDRDIQDLVRLMRDLGQAHRRLRHARRAAQLANLDLEQTRRLLDEPSGVINNVEGELNRRLNQLEIPTLDADGVLAVREPSGVRIVRLRADRPEFGGRVHYSLARADEAPRQDIERALILKGTRLNEVAAGDVVRMPNTLLRIQGELIVYPDPLGPLRRLFGRGARPRLYRLILDDLMRNDIDWIMGGYD